MSKRGKGCFTRRRTVDMSAQPQKAATGGLTPSQYQLMKLEKQRQREKRIEEKGDQQNKQKKGKKK
jgi:hypothetical protein